MSQTLEPCCVCDQAKPRREGVEYLAACAGCEGIYHICFTSVEDAKTHIQSASMSDLLRALKYELDHSLRLSLVKMISRQIAKLKKAKA